MRTPIPNLFQVGMRHFHLLKNRTYTKAVNVDKLWSLLGEGVYEQAKAGKDKAPVLDVTKMVRRGWVCGARQTLFVGVRKYVDDVWVMLMLTLTFGRRHP